MSDELRPEGKGWFRVATHPPTATNTLALPVQMCDGYQFWKTTTNRVPNEDDHPLWWRLVDDKEVSR